jgi:hypothetical protein
VRRKTSAIRIRSCQFPRDNAQAAPEVAQTSQTSQSAVSRVSKPASRANLPASSNKASARFTKVVLIDMISLQNNSKMQIQRPGSNPVSRWSKPGFPPGLTGFGRVCPALTGYNFELQPCSQWAAGRILTLPPMVGTSRPLAKAFGAAPSLYGVRRQSVPTTALLSARERRYIRKRFVRAKAVSPLRSATALQNASPFQWGGTAGQACPPCTFVPSPDAALGDRDGAARPSLPP